MKKIKIAEREIGEECPPYIIAEMSANHNGDINNAYKIISMAKRSGADAVKLQTYKADTITMDSKESEFMINSGLWAGQSLYELYDKAHMPWDWHKPLFDYAASLGITIFSSPFDTTAVDLLEDLNAPAYKIASFEAVDLGLIKYVAQTKKPMIISTGMADFEEIHEAVSIAKEGGCSELVVLHCVSGYPAPIDDYNLKTMVDMQKRLRLPVGLSDHTLSNVTSVAAVALGACVIEKHVTLDRSAGGVDDSFSLEESELTSLCSDSKVAWSAIGKIDYGKKSSEKGNIQFRRSLYFAKNLSEGDLISEEDIRSIRPGYGLPPKNLAEVVGRRMSQNITAGTAVKWNLIK